MRPESSASGHVTKYLQYYALTAADTGACVESFKLSLILHILLSDDLATSIITGTRIPQ